MVYTVDNNALARTVIYAVNTARDIYAGMDCDPYQLHQFLHKKIIYDADLDPEYQRLRFPWRTIADGVTDCKSSAIFIGGLAAAAGHHTVIVFTDEKGSGSWGHVYAVINGIACDPLLPYGVHPNYVNRVGVTI
jgi:hypothetical protein